MHNNTPVKTDLHKFHTHLPHTSKEKIVFMLIISLISVNIIAPIITFSEIGTSLTNYLATLQILPFLWLCVIILVLLTEKPASKLAQKIVKHGDSFSATMTITILCNVLLMSLVLTIVGTWIGSRSISLLPFENFLTKWPRNFLIAFVVEAFIAQPIARAVMAHLHGKAMLTE
jgi:hypothetical protein